MANGTNEFAAFIVNGSSIPDSQFDCPVQYSGLDYVDIPWLNMSVDKYYDPNASFYDGYCGIKGAHPRMAHCCQNMQAQPIKYPDIPIYLAPDNCSQYCRFYPADINYWLWCLTQEVSFHEDEAALKEYQASKAHHEVTAKLMFPFKEDLIRYDFEVAPDDEELLGFKSMAQQSESV
ncbi:hypothetical protein KC331_g6495 [Hortaea werneckii]|nr:hypothetical protein KC331_g6495 [Hortaea werneckii]KAI7715500.1 hypothetical protein KC353_g6067 [Hortaea werneckii]